jgi:hypothetical protein
MAHFFRKTLNRAGNSYPGLRRARFVEHYGQLVEPLLELDAPDDRRTIFGPKMFDRRLVPGDVFRTDYLFEGRDASAAEIGGNIGLVRPSVGMTDEVANSVQHGMPQRGLQTALMVRFEVAQPAHGGYNGLLNEVGRVQHAARGHWDTATGPPLQRRDAPLEQLIDCRLVSLPGSVQELNRRLGWQRGGTGSARELGVALHDGAVSRMRLTVRIIRSGKPASNGKKPSIGLEPGMYSHSAEPRSRTDVSPTRA